MVINTLVFVYVFLVLASIYIMLKDYRYPSKAISWILVMLFVPFLGIFFYLVLGRNLKNKNLFPSHIQPLDSNLDSNRPSPSAIRDHFSRDNEWRLVKLLTESCKAPISFGNEVTLLFDGEETFDAECEAMEKANHHIHLEYYIFEPGKVANRFTEILCRKAKAGVEVRLLYDDVGSWNLSKKEIDCIQESGGEIIPFLPVRFPSFAQRFNYRNHRKILIVDGKTGFVGGLNITDSYLNLIEDELTWRDTHLQLTGKSVFGLQAIFNRDWHFATQQPLLSGEKYFPVPDSQPGNHTVQIVSSGPDSQWANLMHSYFYAVVSAREKVYLSTPYFIPNPGLTTALSVSAMAGIDIRILLPMKSDSRLLYWSMRSYLQELLAAGVRIYMYKPGINHGKTMCVDGRIASVGTANLDIRSFHQNFEVNALVYSKEIAQKLEKRFFDGVADARELQFEEFSKRPAWQKVLESLARLASPLL